MYLRTREGIVVRTLASHHCGWVISRSCFSCRLNLLLIRAFSLGVFLQVLLVFILIKLTFRVPITLRKTIPWEMWNFCSLILICFFLLPKGRFLLHLQAKVKFDGGYGYKLERPSRRNRRQKEKNSNFFRNFSHETLVLAEKKALDEI